ncbi:Serpentine Receptor, class T [Caenorhabditis elegans]|uniref:Serpentine Receptor, class T n=1 Tax=Caenorhabditis elegans TaxID=6239 RepID=A3QMA8_CAEEL|nr:Serpentine Receptor, class T [Caenorhabditis elegans]CAM36340.1 Serpentine Receptor, class T [Caenorhabditis elegans]|eukprot:NP_496614.3 Serpentine Receptor, class E (epsilon) [Caenorhabditis elegans]
MILLMENTKNTIWLPIYSLNGSLNNFYLILALFELISYFLTAILVLKTCKIIQKSKHFHINMNILVIGLISQWFEAFVSKLAIMPYQVGILSVDNSKSTYISWWTSELSDMVQVPNFFQVLALYLPGLFIWHYIYSMFIGVTCVGVERIFATYYIRDYEKTPRKHIGAGLMVLTHCLSFPFSYFMVNNRISFILADTLCIACVGAVCVVYLILWLVNERHRKNLTARGAYHLAQQFQVKENIRHIMLARNIISCATFFVAVTCGLLMTIVLDLIPIWLKNPMAQCIENCIFLNPLLICSVTLFSVPAWKNEFCQSIPIFRKFRNESITVRKSLGPDSDTKEYFNQLKNAWL